MKSAWYFFKLIRPLNIGVIAFTMLVFQFYISSHNRAELFDLNFILLVLSTLLVASAGNIINDYFDVKADRINKPELLIIDKHIKRRWAIVLHWSLNSFGFLMAAYLSWQTGNWMIAILSFVSINLLWFYSAYFKRTLVLGNILVAALTGLVPLYVLLFNNQVSLNDKAGIVLLFFSIYAFWLNLIREIIKDMADIKGDLLLGSKTLPISYGIGKTKIVLTFLFAVAVIPLLAIIWETSLLSMAGVGFSIHIDIPLFMLIAVLIVVIISYVYAARFQSRMHFLFSSNLLKLAMLFGLLIPLFL